jgi:hypothetical protein
MAEGASAPGCRASLAVSDLRLILTALARATEYEPLPPLNNEQLRHIRDQVAGDATAGGDRRRDRP